ncbi:MULTISPECIES: ferredoxin [unclassified Oceanobacter]|jgi:(2Fe-2S) ferredoxin|uniref:(2Fe-2S) ferredoxin domain-containing protein n=1 Tax=unclassified Oceanobacter TaxID=2620260 RepID=UPI0026E17614|nr:MULTISPECIES: (2Fe-2S) ferredoxin domain-containing protein [unclassified Oceanobacter]MDO6682725.1 (2Fe-2S) ferredoxin domain-containing protein [Oceanobacter sp. 5_MG-2023]MDP2507203.1 (2Fe-2S) ferredoxin domain-containing protein [Oceanobacter sp. 3_MG-2023]MDP2549127.1 (2Fe-2S) ferredoxin domain-containing protein [Oceanobacter sp. 4_MG-2023]
MPKPEYHVFVCGQQRPAGHPRSSCGEKGAAPLMQAFSERLIAKGLFSKVSLVATGCLGPCRAGANVLVYPGGTLYIQVAPEDIDQIIDQHLIGGEPWLDKVAPDEVWQ